MNGYTTLYFKLIDEHRPGVLALLVMLVALIVPVTRGVLAFFLPLPGRNQIIRESLAWTLLTLFLAALVFVGLIIWHGIQRPQRFVAALVVRLLIDVPRPYTSDGRGLNHNNLGHLLRVARAEQGAADWRGSFVEIIVISGLATALALQPNIPAFFDFITQLAGTPSAEESQNPGPALAWLDRVAEIIVVLAALILVLATLYFIMAAIMQLGRLFFRYFRDEPVNRATIFACGEARALLEANGLHERESLTQDEKRQLAELCGFHAEPLDEPTDWRAWKITPRAHPQPFWRRAIRRFTGLFSAETGRATDEPDDAPVNQKAVQEARDAVGVIFEEE